MACEEKSQVYIRPNVYVSMVLIMVFCFGLFSLLQAHLVYLMKVLLPWEGAMDQEDSVWKSGGKSQLCRGKVLLAAFNIIYQLIMCDQFKKTNQNNPSILHLQEISDRNKPAWNSWQDFVIIS